MIRPTEPVNISKFGVLVGVRAPGGTVFPLLDNLFWFGDVEVSPPAWILLYTKPGTYHLGTHTDGAPVHSFFWNRGQTVFYASHIVPVVFEMSALNISGSLNPQPALPAKPPRSLESLYRALHDTD